MPLPVIDICIKIFHPQRIIGFKLQSLSFSSSSSHFLTLPSLSASPPSCPSPLPLLLYLTPCPLSFSLPPSHQFAFLNPPTMDLSISSFGGLDLSSIPGVYNWMNITMTYLLGQVRTIWSTVRMFLAVANLACRMSRQHYVLCSG
jgi:hypothetical protein